MLVIAMETQSSPPGRMRWTGRRHDDDESDATSGASAAELFDTVFHALHDGEQVALGFDCPLTMPVAPDHAGTDTTDDLAKLAKLAEQAEGRPGIAELGELLGQLAVWRPWTTVSTSLARWKANTSILVWEAVPAPGSGAVLPGAAADTFFRRLRAAGPEEEPAAGTVVNLAAAASRRAGLFVDAPELARPAVAITVASDLLETD
jgi:hypothetical protein